MDQGGEVVDVFLQKKRDSEVAKLFLDAHTSVNNLFILGRHLGSVGTYQYFRFPSFVFWKNATIAKIKSGRIMLNEELNLILRKLD